MTLNFFVRLASNNIRKQKRLFLPHILSGAGLTAVFYIILTLAMDQRLSQGRGGIYLPVIMGMGTIIMFLLSLILIFYTSSFLMKQRKSEYGLYSVLGLEKRHVGRLLFIETGICSLISVAMGMILGVSLYKLFSMFLCHVLKIDSVLGFYHIGSASLYLTPLLMLGIYLIVYVGNRILLHRMKTIELLKSSQTGEKEPKVKWICLILGILTMGAGYSIALTCDSPLKALSELFIAVLLVMAGTYFLFLAGTIALLKVLKKNKRYYYKADHMIAVSGLLYRMKQNAVGLASICILATGVMIMLSTTCSLYAGIEDSLHISNPHDLCVESSYDSEKEEDTAKLLQPILEEKLCKAAKANGLTVKEVIHQNYLDFVAGYDGERMILNVDPNSMGIPDEQICVLTFLTAAEYERLTGNTVTLKPDEISASWLTNAPSFTMPSKLILPNGSFQIKGSVKDYPVRSQTDQMFNGIGIIVSDDNVLNAMEKMQKEAYGEHASRLSHRVMIDFKEKEIGQERREKLYDVVVATVEQASREDGSENSGYSITFQSKEEESEYMYGMVGTLLSLGLLLGFIFLFATAVIMYYKQLSEGYEDRERFQIMEKVGMSSKEVHKTIKTQILLVFFLPLAVATIHIAVAFPILHKLLQIFFLANTSLFVTCLLICLLIFTLVYIGIYRTTAGIYYRIVK